MKKGSRFFFFIFKMIFWFWKDRSTIGTLSSIHLGERGLSLTEPVYSNFFHPVRYTIHWTAIKDISSVKPRTQFTFTRSVTVIVWENKPSDPSSNPGWLVWFGLVWLGLVWFYGTSTIEGYLMPNPLLYIWIALFQTMQFSISTQFKGQNSSISNNSI